VDIGAMKICWH